MNESLSKEEQKSVLTKWVWWLGIIIYTIGGALNTSALNFAAQSIIAAVGAVNLGFIAILSHFVLKEKLKQKDVIAIVVIGIGVAMVAVFGPSTDSDDELTIDTLRGYFQETPYIILVSILTVITFGIYIGFRYKILLNIREIINNREIREIAVDPNFTLFACVWLSAFFASNNTLFIKASVSLISSTLESKENMKTNLSDPLTYVMVALWPTCMLLMEYFRQKALSLFGAIYVVPFFSVLAIVETSILGMVYFEEYVGFEALNVALYCIGILTVVSGVLVLSLDVGALWDELYEDMIKTAFIDPDEIDYKFPKTVVVGGPMSEWFAKRELRNPTMTIRGSISTERKLIDHQIDQNAGVPVSDSANPDVNIGISEEEAV